MLSNFLILGVSTLASFASAQNNDLVGGLVQDAHGATQGVTNAVQGVTNSQQANDVGQSVNGVAQHVNNTVENAGQTAGNAVQNTAQVAGDAVQNTAQTAGNAVSNVGGAVSQDVSNIAQAALSITQALSGVTAGKEIDIHYTAPKINEPVKILLRKGDPQNLKTISTISDNAVGGVFKWTPAANLVSGADYALQFVQDTASNYYGPFNILGVNIPVYHPRPATPTTNVATLPLATASGSPPPYATDSYTFVHVGATGIPHRNITVLATGTANLAPTQTMLTYVSPTITPGSQITVTAPGASPTGAASLLNTNVGLMAGMLGLIALIN